MATHQQDRRGARLVLVLSAAALAFLSGAFFVKWRAIHQSYNSYRSTGGGQDPLFCISATHAVWFGFATGGLTSIVGFSCYFLFFASDDQYRDVFGYDDDDDAKAAGGGRESY
ncbi:hypothetical protein C2845_PM01G39340 [Panicum miliaceum]|uniref:Uncharacterized protein n=1 Tax=Panicum miliaceum TaxID=4540 RepID=A0A3L6TPN8_PANMI|nr:hypothetical protein C2845_PM01G39340 [Panicum miliaceum]